MIAACARVHVVLLFLFRAPLFLTIIIILFLLYFSLFRKDMMILLFLHGLKCFSEQLSIKEKSLMNVR